jgi:hypothetical protein
MSGHDNIVLETAQGAWSSRYVDGLEKTARRSGPSSSRPLSKPDRQDRAAISFAAAVRPSDQHRTCLSGIALDVCKSRPAETAKHEMEYPYQRMGRWPGVGCVGKSHALPLLGRTLPARPCAPAAVAVQAIPVAAAAFFATRLSFEPVFRSVPFAVFLTCDKDPDLLRFLMCSSLCP